ncbi:MAG: hypothetical protein EBT39_04375, partial [Sphingobacteriia bacterium]|nr:hypothetical protein [Candidatus Fonsibacter lacus]
MAKYKIKSIPQYAPGGETNWAPEWLKKKKKKKKSGEEELVQEEPVVTDESSENTNVLSVPDVPDVEFPTVNVYADEPTRKLQGNLLEKFRQIKNAYQNARAANVEDGDKFNFGLNLEETNDVEKLPGLIERYRKEIEKEKIRFAKNKYTLNQLKQFDPETWNNKNQNKALSAEGLNTLRAALQRGDISQRDFMYAYDEWGKYVDQNVKEGTGPGKEYSQSDLEEKWDSDEMKKLVKYLNSGVNN